MLGATLYVWSKLNVSPVSWIVWSIYTDAHSKENCLWRNRSSLGRNLAAVSSNEGNFRTWSGLLVTSLHVSEYAFFCSSKCFQWTLLIADSSEWKLIHLTKCSHHIHRSPCKTTPMNEQERYTCLWWQQIEDSCIVSQQFVPTVTSISTTSKQNNAINIVYNPWLFIWRAAIIPVWVVHWCGTSLT